MISTVTSKGQVTIPKEIRVFLNVKPSDKINFTVENGQVILTPIKTLQDLRGSVTANAKGDLMAERRQVRSAVSKRVAEEME
jgi:AbrB family looped-hinge helix DNA binding protein